MLDPQIETFLIVAQSGSFSKAAERMYLSKVSVMKQINLLEKRMDFQLFKRTNQGVSLTPAGRLFYDDMVKIKEKTTKAIARAKAVAASETSVIRIGTSSMRSCKPLLAVLDKIADMPFQIQIVPFMDDSYSFSKLFGSLENSFEKNFDVFVGFLNAEARVSSINYLVFTYADCRIAVPKHHPLAAKKILSPSDLKNEKLLHPEPGLAPVFDRIRKECPDIQFTNFQGHYYLDTFNLCERLGCCMISFDIWADLHPSFITLPVDWNYKIPCAIYYAQNCSDIIRRFIELVQKNIS